MLQELVITSRRCGVMVNIGKTKAMAISPLAPALSVNGEIIEELNSFVYLGHEVCIPRNHQKEIRRRIRAGWAVFQQYKSFLTRKNVDRQLKKRLFDMCILPAMLYGSETWTTIKDTRYELAVAQRRMERMMVGVTWQDRVSNEELRRRTKIIDIVKAAAERKAMWAKRITMMDQERWAQAVTYWKPVGKRGKTLPTMVRRSKEGNRQQRLAAKNPKP